MSADEMCGDYPAPCNCDDPETHDGAVTAADRPSVPQVGDTITSAEQIDALPSLTIVIDANEEVQQRHGHLTTESGDYSAWLGVMPPTCKPSPEVALPATVLYVPGDRPSVTDNARAEQRSEYTVEETAAYFARKVQRLAERMREDGYPRSMTDVVTLGSVQAFLDRIARGDLAVFAAGRAETTTDDATQRLARAAFAVDSTHHFHVNSAGRPICTCGFVGDARARTQTEHITAAVLEEYDHD